MSIGERIQELRKKCNISQSQMAKIMDVSRQAVSKWENDLTPPDTIKLIQLADILDTDVEYLATGKHSPKKPPVQVVSVVQKVDNVIEKVVEKPIVIEKIVEVEKPIEKAINVPVLKKVVRVKYVRNPVEFIVLGFICFLMGLLIGVII